MPAGSFKTFQPFQTHRAVLLFPFPKVRKLSLNIIYKVRQLETLETSTFLDRRGDWKGLWAGELNVYFAEHFM